jgi:hypothetical protein
MKHYFLFFLAVGLHCEILFAQPGKTIRVKAGEDVAQAYSPQGFYRFPQFSKATLYFKDGGRNSGALFNYNVLSGNMQFINQAGDTLDMGGAAKIDSIVFEKNVFLYNDGFLEVVAFSDSLRLLKKLVLKTQVENIGAYGQPNATASIVNIKTYAAGTGVFNLIINQDVVVTENISWFFTNGNNIIVKASKGNLPKLLPAEKLSKAEAYLKQNKTNFDKENDLKKLLEALTG